MSDSNERVEENQAITEEAFRVGLFGASMLAAGFPYGLRCSGTSSLRLAFIETGSGKDVLPVYNEVN